jgi:small ubiquitin-related modifier
MVTPYRKEEPVARPFRWAAGGEGGLVAAMAPAVAINPVIKPAMLVTLKVQDTQRRVVARTMRRTDKLQGLMNYYYDMVCSAGAGGTSSAGRFVFDGKRLKGEQTPEDLGMKSGDQIDFFGDLGATDGGDAAAAEEEEVDRKPVIKMHVTVKVQDTDGREVKRTVWITQKLKVLMDYYYDSVPDVTYGTGKFLYNGRQLKAGQTPAELKMEDEDEIVIDFFFDMMGGGCGLRVGGCCCC